MTGSDPVSVPRYVFKLVGGLLMLIMVSGAATTILGLVWLMALTFGVAGTNKQLKAIRDEQRQVRLELKEGQKKTIKEIKEAVER